MQFDVYANINEATKQRFPFLLDVQHGLLDSLDTRMIIPLRARLLSSKAVDRLMPIVALPGGEFVVVTPHLASMPKKWLGHRIGNLEAARSEIVRALDLLFTGV